MPTQGFLGYRIVRDQYLNGNFVSDRLKIPVVNSPDLELIQNSSPSPQGSIVYNPVSNSIFYSDGVNWFELSSGGSGGGNTLGYSFIKSGPDMSVPIGVDTPIAPWIATPSPPYSTFPLEWDLTTGIYTANTLENVSFHVCVTWSPGFSNAGKRYIRIQYRPNLSFVWSNIKETVTQPDADVNVVTTQECAINARLNFGDSVRIVCYQDSNKIVKLMAGDQSSLCGIKMIL